MNVSFTPLTLVEARSITTKYIVLYSPQQSRKRQALSKDVPKGQSSVVVGGLDPGTSYDVRVMVTNGLNSTSTSEAESAPAPSE